MPVLFFVLSVLCLRGENVYASWLTLSGDFDYQSSQDSGGTSQQRYTANASKHLAYSDALTVSANLRYSRLKSEFETTDYLSPSLVYALTNDIFHLSASLAATETFNTNTTNTSSRSWQMNWSNAWKRAGYIPSLSFYYGHDWQFDNSDPRMSDTEQTIAGSSVGWDFDKTKVRYSFSSNENRNKVLDTTSRNDSHVIRADGGTAFWQDRANVFISQQINFNKQKDDVRVDSDGTALIRIPNFEITPYYTEVDPNANAALPLLLPDTLQNGDYNTAAISLGDPNPVAPQRMNIGVLSNIQPVTTLFLYTTTSLTVSEQSKISQWDLYSSTNNFTWTLAQTNISVSYNGIDQRYEMDIAGINASYLKIVAIDNPANVSTINFSEIELYRLLTTSSDRVTLETDSSTYRTDLGLSLNLTDDLTFNSNGSWRKTDSSSGGGITTINATGGLAWVPSNYFQSRINASQSTRSQEERLDEMTRSYGINFLIPPIPTVDTILGASVSEIYEDSNKLSINYNYSLDIIARLYKDLGANYNLTYSETEDNRTNSKTNSTRTTLALNARLLPSLNSNLSGSYSKSGESNAAEDLKFSLNWRISDILSLSTSTNQSWGNVRVSNVAVSAGYALTRKMQLSVAQNISFEPETLQSYSFTWIWNISNFFTLQTGGHYQDASSGRDWNIFSRLNARYSLL